MARIKWVNWFFAVVVLVFVIGLSILILVIPKPKPFGYDHPNRVLTADELLETLEQKQDFWEREFRPTFLPEAELQVVKKVLQTRYPVVSIRDRLFFQESHPGPVQRKIVWREDSRSHSDGFHSQRARALSELHSNEVFEFINRAGQGMQRSPPPEPLDLRIWDSYEHPIFFEQVDSKVLGEPLVSLDGSWRTLNERNWLEEKYWALSSSGLPRKELVEHFHRNVQDGFARADSLGYVDNVDHTVGFQSHRVRLPESWNGNLRSSRIIEAQQPGMRFQWKVNRIQLVSMLMHETAVVYETENLPNMDELSGVDSPTRQLNDFEATSLDELLRGKDVVAQSTENRIVMLGAIRAKRSCLECHNVKQKELLGAFSYELIRKPVLEAKRGNPL